MISTNNGTELKEKIKSLFNMAFDVFVNDKAIYERFTCSSHLINDMLNEAMAQIINEMLDLPLQLGKRVESKIVPPVINNRAGAKKHELFVVLPIFNADDETAVKCINSCINNFGSENFCLVVFTNREWRKMENLLSDAIPFIEFSSPSFSLPFAYNTAVQYLRSQYGINEEIIIFMDDDAEIVNKQNKEILNNIQLVKDDSVIAASGHYYDNTQTIGVFQKALDVSHNKDFVLEAPKPFCHGGACLMMKGKSFPANGLPYDGLGGISLNVLLIKNTTIKTKKWFLYNNPNMEVWHPRKKNLLQWSATYLSYEIAWGRALSWLEPKNKEVWLDMLKKSTNHRTDCLIKLVNKQDAEQSSYALCNLLLTKYYKPMLCNYLSYDDFKAHRLQTHINL